MPNGEYNNKWVHKVHSLLKMLQMMLELVCWPSSNHNASYSHNRYDVMGPRCRHRYQISVPHHLQSRIWGLGLWSQTWYHHQHPWCFKGPVGLWTLGNSKLPVLFLHWCTQEKLTSNANALCLTPWTVSTMWNCHASRHVDLVSRLANWLATWYHIGRSKA